MTMSRGNVPSGYNNITLSGQKMKKTPKKPMTMKTFEGTAADKKVDKAAIAKMNAKKMPKK